MGAGETGFAPERMKLLSQRRRESFAMMSLSAGAYSKSKSRKKETRSNIQERKGERER